MFEFKRKSVIISSILIATLFMGGCWSDNDSSVPYVQNNDIGAMKYLLYTNAEEDIINMYDNIEAKVQKRVTDLGDNYTSSQLNFLTVAMISAEAYNFVQKIDQDVESSIINSGNIVTLSSTIVYIEANREGLENDLTKRIDSKIAKIGKLSQDMINVYQSDMIDTLISYYKNSLANHSAKLMSLDDSRCSISDNPRECYKNLPSSTLCKLFGAIERTTFYPSGSDNPTATTTDVLDMKNTHAMHAVYDQFMGTLQGASGDSGDKLEALFKGDDLKDGTLNAKGGHSTVYSLDYGTYQTQEVEINSTKYKSSEPNKQMFALATDDGYDGTAVLVIRDVNHSVSDYDFDPYTTYQLMDVPERGSTYPIQSGSGISVINIDDDIISEIVIAGGMGLSIYKYNYNNGNHWEMIAYTETPNLPDGANSPVFSVSTMYSDDMKGMHILIYTMYNMSSKSPIASWNYSQYLIGYYYNFKTKQFSEVPTNSLKLAIYGGHPGFDEKNYVNHDHPNFIGMRRSLVNNSSANPAQIIYETTTTAHLRHRNLLYLKVTDEGFVVDKNITDGGLDLGEENKRHEEAWRHNRFNKEARWTSTARYVRTDLVSVTTDIQTVLIPPPCAPEDGKFPDGCELEDELEDSVEDEKTSGSGSTQSYKFSEALDSEIGELSVGADGSQGWGSGSEQEQGNSKDLTVSSGTSVKADMVVLYNMYDLLNYSYLTILSNDPDRKVGSTFHYQAYSNGFQVSATASTYDIDYNKTISSMVDISYDNNDTAAYLNKYANLTSNIKGEWDYLFRETDSSLCRYSDINVTDFESIGTSSCSIELGKEFKESDTETHSTSYSVGGSIGYKFHIIPFISLSPKLSFDTDWESEQIMGSSHTVSHSTKLSLTYPDSKYQAVFENNQTFRPFLGVLLWTDENYPQTPFPKGTKNLSYNVDTNKSDDNITYKDRFTVMGAEVMNL